MSLTATRAQLTSYQLSAEPAQVRRAREEARKALFGWGLGEHADLAELIVSEQAASAAVRSAALARCQHIVGDPRDSYPASITPGLHWIMTWASTSYPLAGGRARRTYAAAGGKAGRRGGRDVTW